MRTLPVILLFAVSVVNAFPPVRPVLPPPSPYADTESVTNVAFNAGIAGDNFFALTLELDASPSNNVEVAFGHDANGNGALDDSEADLAVGWDCGEWFFRDIAADIADSCVGSCGGSDGLLVWNIIWGWGEPNRSQGDSPIKAMTTPYNQTFTFDEYGTLTVSKFQNTVSRGTNNVIRLNGDIVAGVPLTEEEIDEANGNN